MTDCLIIGAGPAGLSAAIACAENGLKVTVVDEFMKPGGRLLGQLHEEPNGVWWNGLEEAQKLFQKTLEKQVTIHLETSVHHIEKVLNQWHVHTNHGTYKAKQLLIATGAAEKTLPIPGWTLPGVMSIGAAQVMTNVHRVKPGHKGIIIGINVLSLAIARELTLAGVKIEGIVLPDKNLLTEKQADPKEVFKTLLDFAHLAPSTIIKIGGSFTKRSNIIQKAAVGIYPKKGFKVWGIPIQVRRAVTNILGKEKVEGVSITDVTAAGEMIAGSEKTIPIDFVCIAGGLYPLAELASVAGCPFKYLPSLGGHVPVHNERMQTPIEGLFVAGNITGIESAKVAMDQGKLAGLSMASAQGKLADENRMNQAIEHVIKTRREALIQFHPDIQNGRDQLQAFANTFGEVGEEIVTM